MATRVPLRMAPDTPAMPATSRYHHVSVAEREDSGRPVRYLRRRFVRDEPGRAEAVVTVPPGLRADQLADALIGAPDQWWRLADANAVRTAEDLEQAGRTIRLPSDDA